MLAPRNVAGVRFAHPEPRDTSTRQGGRYAEPQPFIPLRSRRFDPVPGGAGKGRRPARSRAASAALWPRFAGYYQRLARLPRKVRRSLPLWRRSLGSLALLCALSSVPAMAATINVGVNGCTLVDAITAANSSVATGGCPAGSEPFPASGVSGADTIVLPTNSVHTLTAVNNNTFGPTGLPVVTSIITIEGRGSTIRRDPAAPEFFRILAVGPDTGSLILRETTITGGSLPNSGNSGNNGNDRDGGGILNVGWNVRQEL
jgi:hypothetical protein